jgi:hypothetical protein
LFSLLKQKLKINKQLKHKILLKTQIIFTFVSHRNTFQTKHKISPKMH